MVVMMVMPMIVTVLMLMSMLVMMNALGRAAAARILAKQERFDGDGHGI